MKNPIRNNCAIVDIPKDGGTGCANEIKESAEKYYRLIQTAHLAIISSDSNGNIASWNRRAQEIFGYDEEEAIGNPFSILIHEDFREEFEDRIEQYIATRDSKLIDKTIEILGLSKAGMVFPEELSLSSYVFKGKLHITGIIRDIRARKKTEQALKESEEKFRTLVNNIPDVVFSLDKNGVFVSINPAVEKITGFEPSHFIGTCLTDHVPDEDLENAQTIIQERRTGNRALKNFEIRIKTKDGLVKDFDFNVSGRYDLSTSEVVSAENYMGVQGVARDITERKEIEQTINLIEKTDALGELVGGITHEINNPAAAVMSYLDSIGKYLRRMPDNDVSKELIEIVESAQEAQKRVTDIVLAMKNSYRPETWRQIDIKNEIECQLTLLYKKYKGRIEIERDYASLSQVSAYGNEIGQVILNILDNAIHAIEGKGKIAIKTEEAGKSIRILISDTGEGIPHDVLPLVAKPYFTTKGEEGTGLGLATSAEIAHHHNGKLYVAHTEVGKGTTFALEFPKSSENYEI